MIGTPPCTMRQPWVSVVGVQDLSKGFFSVGFPKSCWGKISKEGVGVLGSSSNCQTTFLGFCLDWTTIDYMKHENSVQSIGAVPMFRLFVVVAKCLP